ncbi:MAG: hypothetical protein NVS1B7_0960 [Candidatus Saccharimonadales bacterium]
MYNPEQPSLFGSESDSPAPSFDAETFATNVAAAADAKAPVEYVDRTSEAARDQGHGVLPVTPDLDDLDETNKTDESSQSHLFNQQNMLASRTEARRGLTPEEIARQYTINSQGAAKARAALEQPPQNSEA